MINLTNSDSVLHPEVPGRYYVLTRRRVSLKTYYKSKDAFPCEDLIAQDGDFLEVRNIKSKNLIESWVMNEGVWEIIRRTNDID